MPTTNNEYHNYQFGKKRRKLVNHTMAGRVAVARKEFRFQRLVSDAISRKAREIHTSGVLDFMLDRTALWVGRLRKVGIDFAILDYIEWLGFWCEL